MQISLDISVTKDNKQEILRILELLKLAKGLSNYEVADQIQIVENYDFIEE
jgi:hypothetical protein